MVFLSVGPEKGWTHDRMRLPGISSALRRAELFAMEMSLVL